MRRSGFTMSLGERSPAATSCSIGVNKMKFSRLISVTSTSARRASVLSRYIAALSPANPPPKITMLVFFIRPPRLPTIVDAVAGLTFHGELQRHLSFYTCRYQGVLSRVRCSFFDQSCHLLRPGDVNRVTGARDFDLVALGSCGIPPFEVGVDGSVFCRYQHPARFASPRRCGDDCFEIV